MQWYIIHFWKWGNVSSYQGKMEANWQHSGKMGEEYSDGTRNFSDLWQLIEDKSTSWSTNRSTEAGPRVGKSHCCWRPSHTCWAAQSSVQMPVAGRGREVIINIINIIKIQLSGHNSSAFYWQADAPLVVCPVSSTSPLPAASREKFISEQIMDQIKF